MHVIDGKSYILKEISQNVTYLSLDENDAIYSSSFALMIKEAFRDDKHFIVAKLQSRSSDTFKNVSSEL